VQGVSSFRVPPDAPVVRSLVDHGPLLRAVMRCPVPGVSEAAVLPLADAVASPLGSPPPSAWVTPGFHGGLLGTQWGRRALGSALRGGPLPTPPALGAFGVWQVPALRGDLNPAWSGSDALDCAEVPQQVSVWLHAVGALRPQGARPGLGG
jgi:hypothetical protein